MTASKISVASLRGVAETLLPVLYARVVETHNPDGIFKDPIAEAWVKRIDYDFSRFDASALTHLGVAIRTEILDEYTRAYLDAHPAAIVVNIGAGLDTRFYRMDNGNLTWIELDLPQSIALRKALMEDNPRHRCLAASALDFAWMDEIPAGDDYLFIVEGLLMYFTDEQVQSLLQAIAERFPGAELLLEVMGVSQSQRTHLSDAINKTSAEFRWGIRDAVQMANYHPRLQYLSDTSIYDRYETRWLAMPIAWKDKPSAYRNSVDRIVHLRVAK